MSRLLAIPDDPAAVPDWLARQLVGPDLDALVAELRVVHRPGVAPDLDALLGGDRGPLLAGGFAALPRPTLASLMRNPDLQLELQPLVFAEGGDRWFDAPPDPRSHAADDDPDAERVTAKVMQAIAVEPRPAGRRRWREYAAVSLATAAAVLVAVYIGGLRPASPVAGGWGFAKLDALPRDAPPSAVYAALADPAAEWGQKSPADAPALAKRLGEFRQGCAALQLAADLPLPDAERRWLRGRCRGWAADLDGHLRALEDTGDAATVRAAAGATARSVAAELRERAAGV